MGWCSSKLIVHRLWQDSFVLIANPGAPVCGYTVWKVKVDTESLIKTDRENGMERICFPRALNLGQSTSVRARRPDAAGRLILGALCFGLR